MSLRSQREYLNLQFDADQPGTPIALTTAAWQGRAVILSQTSDIPATLRRFNLIHQFCPELLCECGDQLIQIFDHSHHSETRPVEIEPQLILLPAPAWNELTLAKELKVVDIQDLWPETVTTQTVSEFVASLDPLLTQDVVLSGDAPLAAYLLAINHRFGLLKRASITLADGQEEIYRR